MLPPRQLPFMLTHWPGPLSSTRQIIPLPQPESPHSKSYHRQSGAPTCCFFTEGADTGGRERERQKGKEQGYRPQTEGGIHSSTSIGMAGPLMCVRQSSLSLLLGFHFLALLFCLFPSRIRNLFFGYSVRGLAKPPGPSPWGFPKRPV